MQTTIQGYQFEVTTPYAAGHTINEVEAQALNQLRAENIGNNQRKVVQAVIDKQDKVTNDEGKEVPKPLTAGQVKGLQTAIAKYDEGYTLAMSRGGVSRDPVEKMARTIARQLIERQAKAEGMTLAQYREKVGKDKYNAKVTEVAAMEAVRKQAELASQLSL